MKSIDAVSIGVKAAFKILQIKEPNIYFNKSTDFSNPSISSFYHKSTHSIVFNEDWAAQVDELESIKIWKSEFEGYNKPSNTNDSKNDESYLKQAIEIDAIAFAYHQMKELFDVKVSIPFEILNEVQMRLEKISTK